MEEEKGKVGIGLGAAIVLLSTEFGREATDLALAIAANLYAVAIFGFVFLSDGDYPPSLSSE